MRHLIRRLRIPKLYFELGIIALGAAITGLAIWFFDAWPYLVNWGWFIAGMFFGIVILCLVVAFFAFGARGDGSELEESELGRIRERIERMKSKPRLVQNDKPKSEDKSGLHYRHQRDAISSDPRDRAS